MTDISNYKNDQKKKNNNKKQINNMILKNISNQDI